MQDAKEDSSWFERNIKKKIRDWESKDLFNARWAEYFFLLVVVNFAVTLIFKLFNLSHTDATSARYMLSALVQSQAAIIAIVVSLTFIAVQLTASAYTPRVVDIFRNPKKNPDFWILLAMYGFSIFFGLLILKMIRGVDDASQIIISNHPSEGSITYVYAMGISTFAILCFYIWNTMALLSSETLINRLATEITKDNLLNQEEDPIQPIIDIMHGSIMKYDIATTRVGLEAVTDRVIEFIDSDDDEEISKNFCNHLERVGKLAISREDEEAALEVIKKLEKIGQSTAEKGLKKMKKPVLESLEELSKIAGRRGLREVLEIVTATHAKINDLKIT